MTVDPAADRPRRIYIAGPYTDDPEACTAAAIAAGAAVLDAGHAPLVPHLAHYWETLHGPRPYEDWMRIDLAWLAAADAVLRLPGVSAGADREVTLARERGVPVFADLAALLRWAVEAQPEASPLDGRKTAFSAGEGVHGQDPYYGGAEAQQPDTETRPGCPDPIECSHEAALGEAQQQVKRLSLMVDEYGHGASALTDKLKRARDMHRETCPWVQGGAPSPAFKCGMCEVLDAPAVPVQPAAAGSGEEARVVRCGRAILSRPHEPHGDCHGFSFTEEV